MLSQRLQREIERVFGDDVFCITLRDANNVEIEIYAEKDKIRNVLKVWIGDHYTEIPHFDWENDGVWKLLYTFKIHRLI